MLEGGWQNAHLGAVFHSAACSLGSQGPTEIGCMFPSVYVWSANFCFCFFECMFRKELTLPAISPMQA